MKMKVLVLIAVFVCATVQAEVSFSKKPQAEKKGDKTIITFKVSEPTDVEVAVLDSKGNIVRHLAAGVLGKNPPKPLKPGLSQSLEWDKKDDNGKKAEGGPFKVRVRAGMKPEFESFLLYNQNATGNISHVAVGPKGNLYLLPP